MPHVFLQKAQVYGGCRASQAISGFFVEASEELVGESCADGHVRHAWGKSKKK